MDDLNNVTAAQDAGDAVGVLSTSSISPSLCPVCCGTAATPTSSPRHWFVAYVGHNTEKASRDRLEQLGYEAFVASQKEMHVWRNGKRKKIERIVITTYVFVYVTEQERRAVVNLPFIKSFLVNKAGTPSPLGRRPLAVIPDRQMELLRTMLRDESDPVRFTSAAFSLGDTVRVLGWEQTGFQGHVVRLRGDNAPYFFLQYVRIGCLLAKGITMGCCCPAFHGASV